MVHWLGGLQVRWLAVYTKEECQKLTFLSLHVFSDKKVIVPTPGNQGHQAILCPHHPSKLIHDHRFGHIESFLHTRQFRVVTYSIFPLGDQQVAVYRIFSVHGKCFNLIEFFSLFTAK